VVTVANPQPAQKKVKVSNLQQDMTFAVDAKGSNN
jgi:hypothetical protein